MKKLVMAAMVAGSLLTLSAAETSAPAAAQGDKAPAAETKAEPAKRPLRHQLTQEQREKMHAKHKEFLARRKAEMEQRAVAVIKKYGLDDEKAKALYAELIEAIRPQRRPRPMPPAPAAAPAAK